MKAHISSVEDLCAFFEIMMWVSKHAYLVHECITYYIYAYQLRCPKQDVLRTLIKVILYVRHRSKAYILVCIASKAASVLLLARYI